MNSVKKSNLDRNVACNEDSWGKVHNSLTENNQINKAHAHNKKKGKKRYNKQDGEKLERST